MAVVALRNWILVGSLVLIVQGVAGDHQAGCVPTSADPSTYTEQSAAGELFYVVDANGDDVPEEVWEETNGLAGLQRGGVGLFGGCFPPQPLPCLIVDVDPINDTNCGHGPDTRLVGAPL